MDVLVTGADQRQSLAVIRSLGKKGIKVVAAGPHEQSMGFYSRHAAVTWVYPNPYENPRRFIESLLEAVQKYNIKMIFPVVESTLVVINQFRSVIQKEAEVVAASKEAVDLSFDKDRQFKIAEQIGIRVPHSIAPSTIGEAEEQIKALAFPVVLKANIKPQDEEKAFEIPKVSYADTWESLQQMLQVYYRCGVQPIIQEIIFGDGIGCGLLMDHERPLCCYQYHRGRENHPTGGVPVRYQSMPLWPEIRDQSIRMLQAMGWHGIAQVEWKNIIGTREIVLMEVNGRFWASLPGAIHAGMDFPGWLYDLWCGLPVACPLSYPIPVISRYLTGDLNRLEILLRYPTPVSSVPLKSKYQETMDFFLDFIRLGVKSDVHQWTDPKPGLMETYHILAGLGQRFGNKLFNKLRLRGSSCMLLL
jgi:predicted ATP-grasp superfamily ATP-dependent carboligase